MQLEQEKLKILKSNYADYGKNCLRSSHILKFM